VTASHLHLQDHVSAAQKCVRWAKHGISARLRDILRETEQETGAGSTWSPPEKRCERTR